MATSLTIPRVNLTVGWEFTNTSGISGALTSSAGSVTFSDNLAAGTGADQADLIYFNDYTVVNGSPTNIDLDTTAPTDVFGVATNFEKIKLLYFEHQTTTATLVTTISGDALTAPTTPILAGTSLSLRPGGVIFVYAPDATAYGPIDDGVAGDVITLTNTDAVVTSVVIRFIVVGVAGN